MKSKTTVNKGNNPVRRWHLVDLKGQTLGRVSTHIAHLLMGKHKSDFSYNLDAGDYVVAINAADIEVTGKKTKDKIYYSHSGYPGSTKALSFREMMEKDPRQVIINSVAGMLPKNKLRQKRLSRLKVFVHTDHNLTQKLSK